MRKMITIDRFKDAPKEVWLEWSEHPSDKGGPELEDCHFEDKGDSVHRIRYIRDDTRE